MSHTDRGLTELAASTAEAVAGVLEGLLPGRVEIGEPEIVVRGQSLIGDLPLPAVAAEVTYIDGASGGNVFVTTLAGARALAAAMTGGDDPAAASLTDDERTAVAEAMTRGMAAAAAATGEVLGEPVEISPPEVSDLTSPEAAHAIGDGAPHVTSVAITIAGEQALLIQLVPKAFVLRMTRALDEIAAQDLGGDGGADDLDDESWIGPEEILRAVPLRVCAEIGRATMPVADAVQLPPGGLVELDRNADEPVDVLVNGQLFATGRLVLVDDEWAVRIEQVLLDAAELGPPSVSHIER